MAVMHESVNDPQLVAAANVFVDDIIETAKIEAAQRSVVNICYTKYLSMSIQTCVVSFTLFRIFYFQ